MRIAFLYTTFEKELNEMDLGGAVGYERKDQASLESHFLSKNIVAHL